MILEVLRKSSIAPIGVFHEAVSDTKFHGYDIPKGTWVGSNIYAVHHSPEHWGNPQAFNPQHFLSADGKSLKRSEALLAFSVGKRACLGETLARDELFLFLANIYQRFETKLAEESLNVGIEPKSSFLLGPQDYKIIIKERETVEKHYLSCEPFGINFSLNFSLN